MENGTNKVTFRTEKSMPKLNAHVEQRLCNPTFAEKYEALLQSIHEAGLENQDLDWQALVAGYSQPIRATPTRFLFG